MGDYLETGIKGEKKEVTFAIICTCVPNCKNYQFLDSNFVYYIWAYFFEKPTYRYSHPNEYYNLISSALIIFVRSLAATRKSDVASLSSRFKFLFFFFFFYFYLQAISAEATDQKMIRMTRYATFPS